MCFWGCEDLHMCLLTPAVRRLCSMTTGKLGRTMNTRICYTRPPPPTAGEGESLTFFQQQQRDRGSGSQFRMTSPQSMPVRKVVGTEQDVGKHLCTLVEQLSNEAIEARGRFTIGLSGGSMAKLLCSGLPSIQTKWDKWLLFFCDERLVSFSNDDSTYKIYKAGLIGKTALKEEQFMIINPDLEVQAAAKDYEEKVRAKFPDSDWPRFDLLLLGMGPDGHTASLFPGHPLLDEKSVWIAAIGDSPKPPPCRVTMTFPVINNARCCAFAMAGEGKADMVKRILGDGEALPSGMVKPTKGELIWILDEAAASKL